MITAAEPIEGFRRRGRGCMSVVVVTRAARGMGRADHLVAVDLVEPTIDGAVKIGCDVSVVNGEVTLLEGRPTGRAPGRAVRSDQVVAGARSGGDR
jgi:hypothetical protein